MIQQCLDTGAKGHKSDAGLLRIYEPETRQKPEGAGA